MGVGQRAGEGLAFEMEFCKDVVDNVIITMTMAFVKSNKALILQPFLPAPLRIFSRFKCISLPLASVHSHY